MLRSILVLLLVLIGSSLIPERARAASEDYENQIYLWPKWQRGFELGGRAMGRFGRGSNLNAPPGDWMIHAAYHIWNNHLLEFHGALDFGVSNSTLVFGAGAKINLLEFIEDPTHELIVRGLQRGILANVIKNFMIYLGVDFAHYGFKEPDASLGMNYVSSEWKIVPSAGVQWFFYIPQEFAGRFYMETSLGYAQFSSSNYFLPMLTFGAELL